MESSSTSCPCRWLCEDRQRVSEKRHAYISLALSILIISFDRFCCTSTGETSGTTATFVIVDRWIVTVASVGDSRCILDTQDGEVTLLTVDHRLEENVEE